MLNNYGDDNRIPNFEWPAHMAIRVAGDIVAAATIFSITLILLVIF